MVYLQSQTTVVHIMNVALMPLALKGITTISPVNVIIHEADASATVNIYLFLTHRIFHPLKMKIVPIFQKLFYVAPLSDI